MSQRDVPESASSTHQLAWNLTTRTEFAVTSDGVPQRTGNNLDPWYANYAERAAGLAASEVRALFAVASRPEVVSLAGGMPFVSALPQDLIVSSMQRVMTEQGPTALQYGSGQGIPALREQILEVMSLEGISGTAERNAVIGRSLRQADIPADSKVAGLIRGQKMVVPRGDERIRAGDRVVVIGSPDAARAWSKVVSGRERSVDDVVVFGAGRMGTAIAGVLLERGLRVRVVDARRERVAEIAESLPKVRAFHAEAFDSEFLDHICHTPRATSRRRVASASFTRLGWRRWASTRSRPTRRRSSCLKRRPSSRHNSRSCSSRRPDTTFSTRRS